MRYHSFRLAILALFFSLAFTGLARAQQAVGVVTALRGKAQLSRAATQTALRFKDDLILRDLIDTQEKSLARVLFGGKSTVTVRELSSLEVREELLPGGTTRTVHDLSSGSILVNVARSLLRKGDEVQIRTPNAVAAVRGSAVFVQYDTASALSSFTVLTGSAVVTPQGQPSITLTQNTSVEVTGTAASGVQAGPVGTVTQAEATEIVEGSEVGVAVTEEANQEQTAQVQTEQATQLVEAVVEAVSEPVEETIGSEPPSEPETTIVEETSEEPGGDSGTVSETVQETARAVPFTFETDTTSSDTPFFQVNNKTIDISGNLITVNSGVTVTLGGTLIAIDPSTIATTGSLFRIDGASLTLGGSLLISVNNIITAGTLLDISNKSSLTNTAGPFIKITGGSLTADSLVDSDESGNTYDLTGTILDLKDTTVTLRVLEDDFATPDLDDFNLTVAANEPLFQLDNSTLKLTGTTNGEELVFIGSVDLSGGTFQGIGLIAKNGSTITNNDGGLFSMEGILSTTTTQPLVQITGSSVATLRDAMFEIEPPPSGSTSVTMTGPLLNASASSTLTSERNFFEIRDSSSVTSNTTNAFIQFDNATVNVGTTSFDTHFFQAFNSGSLSLAGPLVSATDSTLNVSSFFLEVVNGGQLTSTSTSPLVQLTNSSLKALSGAGNLDAFLFLSGSGSGINIAGTLLSATNSNLTIDNDLFQIFSTSPSGSQLFTTSDDPLVLISGGTHSFGGSLFEVLGLGTTDQPIEGSGASFTVNGKTASNPIGALFKATNAADITADFGVELDGALFEATLPVIELIGSSTTQTKITSNFGSFVDIGETAASKLVLKGPVIALDNGLIKVNSGPLLSLRNGSTMDVLGNLLKLINGSTINVVNGPLIRVDGSGTALDVTNALLNFGNTSGNTVLVNNPTASNGSADILPVFTSGGGSVTITTGFTKINDPGGNTVSITGAAIEATNSATVTIGP